VTASADYGAFVEHLSLIFFTPLATNIFHLSCHVVKYPAINKINQDSCISILN